MWRPGTSAPPPVLASEINTDSSFDLSFALPSSNPQRGASSSSSKSSSSQFQLPIRAHRRQLLYALERNQIVVVVGETGSGKSTQVSWRGSDGDTLMRAGEIVMATHRIYYLRPPSPPAPCHLQPLPCSLRSCPSRSPSTYSKADGAPTITKWW